MTNAASLERWRSAGRVGHTRFWAAVPADVLPSGAAVHLFELVRASDRSGSIRFVHGGDDA